MINRDRMGYGSEIESTIQIVQAYSHTLPGSENQLAEILG